MLYGSYRAPFTPHLLLRNPVMRQFLDVVNEAKQLPLPIDFCPPAQREAIQLWRRLANIGSAVAKRRQ